MLFSIIIPTYNRAQIVKETLKTVLAQTFTDFEVIVVDDGSTDNTAEVIQKLNNPKIKYYYKKNEERSIARNYGADKASGDYVIFLDSDDKMKPDHLLAISSFIASFKKPPEFIFSGYIILNPDGSILYEYGVNGLFPVKKLFYGNFLGCSSVVISKQLFQKYYFNTDRDLILFEDWELWLRVISDNKLYCFPNKSIMMMNHTGRSVLNYQMDDINNRISHFRKRILTSCNAIKNSFKNRKTFLMGIYSYAALHIAMTKKNRVGALKYFLLAFINNPALIFKRRFFGIIKQLF